MIGSSTGEAPDKVRDAREIRLLRREVRADMRVNVQFEDKILYGGTIAEVVDGGRKVGIEYDDGTYEMSDYLDKDMVVGFARDHFCQPCSNDNIKTEEGKMHAAGNASTPQTSQANGSDSDDDAELGASIYKLMKGNNN